MKELNFEQAKEVSGGNPLLWMVGGCFFGRAADAYEAAVLDGSAVPGVDPGFEGGPHNNDPLL